MCDKCVCQPVCSIYRATGGVKQCEHYKEERRGEWVNTLGNYQVAECSECENWYEVSPDEKPCKEFFDAFCEFYKFCPNCGADMRGNKDG